MHVIATAGHVDHGKSTLVRALTGMEPDRLEEERRRGLTIELGFVWTTLEAEPSTAAPAEPHRDSHPDSQTIAFVDVPGHHRFLSTMLAGVGPVPAAMLVVAADGGWEAQTAEHVAALDALGVRHGLVAITRSDLADPEPVRAEVLERLRTTSFGGSGLEAIAVSGRTGAGLDELRGALSRLVAKLPPPDRTGRIRLWVDRAFTIDGAGTVITGTLGQGTLRVGDDLQLAGRKGVRAVRVRSLQSLERSEQEVSSVARVAVNLRGIPVAEVARGDALLTPGADLLTSQVDVFVDVSPELVEALPTELVLHFGAASVPIRLRPLGDGFARLTLDWALALRREDRALLRDPGRHSVAAAVVITDLDPPALARRGAARERATALSQGLDLVEEVSRRGAVRRSELDRLGLLAAKAELPSGLREVRGRVVAQSDWKRWTIRLGEVAEAARAADPLSQGLAPAEAAQRAGIPAVDLMEPLVQAAKLTIAGGRISAAAPLPPAAAAAIELITRRLRADPFDAPEAAELASAGLTAAVLAAAERHGLLLRLAGTSGPVVLLPDAPDLAAARLSALPAPFTVSDARSVLGTSRRIAVPLLEHLDATRRTRRIDASGRVLI
jgi:selenocysteine-specific elongation factor